MYFGYLRETPLIPVQASQAPLGEGSNTVVYWAYCYYCTRQFASG
jgi:hypothetical protein